MPPTILISAGTRPEAIKVAPVVRLLRQQDWCRVRLLATAQHRELADQVFRYFDIAPDIDLDIMQPGQGLAELTGRLIPAIDRVLAAETPDIVLAQGDTTTVMTTALCCYYRRIAFGHIEAGLRTGNKFYPFPEEMNRALVGRLCDLHFAPTPQARDHLLAEGIRPDAIHVTGNTVIDALQWTARQALPQPSLPGIAPQGGGGPADGRRLILVTAHRRENFGPPMEAICAALRDLAARGDVEILYPVHPNPNVQRAVQAQLAGVAGIHLAAPLDYAPFVAAMKAAHIILTDSGGVQEEAPAFGKPVLVLRDETERPEGVAAGTACLVGPHRERIVAKATELLDDPAAYEGMARAVNPYGDGHASERIAEILRAFLAGRTRA